MARPASPPTPPHPTRQAAVAHWRLSWAQAAALGAAAALAVELLQGLVEVYCETLAFTPGQGVRFEARRRSGIVEQSRSVPLDRLDCALIHEVCAAAACKRLLLFAACLHSCGGAARRCAAAGGASPNRTPTAPPP